MKILLIEDDVAISKMLAKHLSASAHNVEVADNGKDGLFMARNYQFDAVVLDYSLPIKDGLTICKEIRTSGNNTPIIFLSVFGDTDLKIQALEMGADDYMTKPFSLEEMHARIKAIARRPREIKENGKLYADDLILDTKTRKVTRKNEEIYLTRKEFSLLEYMLRHRGMVLSRTMIMEKVWSADSDPFSNTVEAHISNLRRKINKKGMKPLIKNVSGYGYIIAK